ncbi:serine O-acetyltransferase [Treponema socranskii]
MGGGYKRIVECFVKSNCKYFREEKDLNPFNSVMYTNYMYQVSHLLYKDGYSHIADKLYYLNKMLNAVDLFYAIELPEHWNCEHPLGSVMGRAKYGDYFFFYQGCTIGGNHTNYPVLGDHVTMYSNSKVLGKSHIGNNVLIGANAYIKDTDIPDDSIVFGQFPNLIIKPNKNADVMWK